ncbi:MAG: hypothetical protein COU63_03905 [Candidatus Pacebacteria bacterium CG10_big_fil_rev_8_21_14_0_10_36_11]|nr:glycosyltransferase [Candidatus Pacearchaeota archaeon]OIP74143.1 MAG: hypothetical protein AUK08_02740 [Candidatus Pacebacteria bacterium CG2_30_36_39]PIR64513.1 MAG: hypothetical protein COU63_03905 [Candidatus Pacebacteria bacterium CG10_big_fil_rev_8_21_14_0_10_36_11]
MKNNLLVSVIIPTFNEKQNISLLITKLEKQLQKISHEIIVVDDHSSDGTITDLTKLSRSNQNISFYLNPPPVGLSKSILLGITKAKGKVIVGMDADFNHDPAVINNLIKSVVSDDFDLVVASRFMAGGGMDDKLRFYTTKFFNYLLRKIFLFPITDNTSGYYAIQAKVLKKMSLKKIYQGYGEYHLRLVYTAKRMGLRIKEIPVYYQERKYGVSKSKLFEMLKNYFILAFKLRFNLQ